MRRRGHIGLEDVVRLRTLLRRDDRAARQVALALLATWSADRLDPVGARAVLEAAGGSYPMLTGSLEHPGELLARMLWRRPTSVEVSDVLRVYAVAGEPARRALLHLLAARDDDDGLLGLEALLGPSAVTELSVVPTTPLLDPLVTHVDRPRVTELLISLLARPEWAWHAADLLARTEATSPSRPEVRRRMLDRVEASAERLVDRCNRSAQSDRRLGDDARPERQTLSSLLWLLDELAGDRPSATLWAMLGSADPRVAAMGATRLLARDEPVAPERLGLIARDPAACADLHDALSIVSPGDADRLDPLQVAAGELVRWLSDVTELGHPPDEVEFAATVAHPADVRQELHVFRFRVHPPHWSAARGWMIGLGGSHTFSCYSPEDDADLDEHVVEVLSALAEWGGRPADGPA